MKVARIVFGRMGMFTTLGLDTDTFKEMLDQLPKNSKVVGFGGDLHQLLDFVFIHNDLFVDTPEGTTPPEIKVSFMRRFDGTHFCSGVDCNDALGKSVTLTIPTPSSPPSYKVSGHNTVRGFCSKAPWPVVAHEWVTYTSQFKIEDVCKYCGDPKP